MTTDPLSPAFSVDPLGTVLILGNSDAAAADPNDRPA